MWYLNFDMLLDRLRDLVSPIKILIEAHTAKLNSETEINKKRLEEMS